MSDKTQWELARQLIEHEDALVNHRLGWMLAFNGFLFAALALSFSGASNLPSKSMLPLPDVLLDVKKLSETVRVLHFAVGMAGFLSAVAAAIGVAAAFAASRIVKRTAQDKSDPLPLTGSGSTALIGETSALLFPAILGGVWFGWCFWVWNDATASLVYTGAVGAIAGLAIAAIGFFGLCSMAAFAGKGATQDALKDTLNRYPSAETFRFGDSAALNAEILGLVRAGKKTMSCDAVAAFEARGEALPEVGRIDIALDWDGKPALAVQTVQVEHIRFDQMDAARIPPQGEFRDLHDWRTGYEAYLTRTGHFAPDVMMLVETFRVIEDFGQ